MSKYTLKYFQLFLAVLFIILPSGLVFAEIDSIETGDARPGSVNARLAITGYTTGYFGNKAWIEYGKGNYNQKSGDVSFGASGGTYKINIFQLEPNTTYQYRAVAKNSEGTTIYGSQRTFTTKNGATGGSSSSGGGSVSVTSAKSAPVVYTQIASDTTGSSAILNAEVDGQGSSYWWFEWGETESLGNKTPEIGITYKEDVNNYINKLKPDTIYYYRIAARNKYGVKYGNKFVFRTQDASVIDTKDVNTNGSSSTSNDSQSNGGGTNQNSSIQTLVEVRNNTTIIDGIVPAGKPVVGWFEWGDSNRLGNKTEDQKFDGKKDYVFSDTLYNLEEDKTYYAQSVYEVDGVIFRGDMISFSTSPNAKRESSSATDGGLFSTVAAALSGNTVGNDTTTGSQTANAGGSNNTSGDDGGGIFSIFNKNKTGSTKSDGEIRDEFEGVMLNGFSENVDYGWGDYLQGRFFSMSNNAAVFGIASSQFKPYESQQATVAGGGSFLPDTFVEWLFLIVLLVILISVSRSMYLANQKKKIEIAELKKMENEETESAVTA